ncbi:exodeoxyribonuclease III [Rhizorhabdus dicambivorans]|uniref:Exodeoxyribonuclease III n=1 Tax=Rhizorhabdus dicambivorans TaxID=1850238 RepID=A0A2A4G1I6_9SPHN|nr:exodeoxyribonuclease III [Rhizorhabdus dicambivorans]ATE66650.1 exodeoxyribonuclease III [Rhizorhabdus dicambivorans]PCE43865.1 exodeoxyribonuclease III [Rhizorhabdus dicambivorans]
MKIATFNINGIKARLPRLIEWLEQKAPDVACLQEIKTSDETFPIAEIEAAGYGAIWHGQKGFNGVAILAKGAQPIERRKGLPDDPDPTHSRYIEAEVGGVIVGSIYLPNGNPVLGPKFDYKLAWFDRLIGHAADLWASELPVVLAGDYNVIPTPSTDDVFSERAMASDALTQPESRSAFRRLCNAGWTDAVRTVHPHGPVYTFWDYQAGAWQRDAGFRIDHLMLSPAAADRLAGAGVDKDTRGLEKASDHAPTWITLRP